MHFVLTENIECPGVCSFQLDIYVRKMAEKRVHYSDTVHVQLDSRQLASIPVFCSQWMEFQNLRVLDFPVVLVDFSGHAESLVVDFVHDHFCLAKEEGDTCFDPSSLTKGFRYITLLIN